MKPSNILLFISCSIGVVIGFPAVADSQFGHRRAEFSSQEQWQQGNRSPDNKSNQNQSQNSSHRASDRLKIGIWSRDQPRSKQHKSEQHKSDQSQSEQPQSKPRSKPYRISDAPWHRSPGNDSRGGDEHRRSPNPSDQAPPPPQERRERRPDDKPDQRHKDRGQHPPRDHDHRPDKKPDQHKHDNHRPDNRHNEHGHDKRNDRHGDHGHDQRHTPYYPPRHDHRHHPRPNYRLHKRHKYIYYRTPWYNTWFLAPILWHYDRIGFTLQILPTPYIRIYVGGLPYFYASGTFYRPYGSGYIVVSAPVGAVVTTLPTGYIAFSMGLNTYYFVNDTYYVWDEPRDGFVVVPKPEGAERAVEKATQGRLYVYPNEGQSEEQQAKDRYSCHLWAVSESDVDPTLEEQDYSDSEKREYQRAMAACLEGRGYTVK